MSGRGGGGGRGVDPSTPTGRDAADEDVTVLVSSPERGGAAPSVVSSSPARGGGQSSRSSPSRGRGASPKNPKSPTIAKDLQQDSTAVRSITKITEPSTREEHHLWAMSLWARIDRDNSGEVTRDELACDEFRELLRQVMAPDSIGVTESVVYARAEINLHQVIDHCVRKADKIKRDGKLDPDEFEEMLRILRNQFRPKDKADLTFAMFDLDATLTIDRDEFREIHRYFLGRIPTTTEFMATWAQLDPEGKGEVTRKQYARWLARTTDPVFRQHAPPVLDEGRQLAQASSAILSAQQDSVGEAQPRFGKAALRSILRRKDLLLERPSWNERAAGKDWSMANAAASPHTRNYFVRPQSLPELSRFYNAHRGFTVHRERLDAPPSPRKQAVLSTESRFIPHTLDSKYKPAGFQRNCKGVPELWLDNWQEPKLITAMRPKEKVASLAYRCPGPPSESMLKGKDAPSNFRH